jgi:hypothetical protein
MHLFYSNNETLTLSLSKAYQTLHIIGEIKIFYTELKS